MGIFKIYILEKVYHKGLMNFLELTLLLFCGLLLPTSI